MRAPAALTSGHRSKHASGAGSAFTAPRCTASAQLSIDTHREKLARNPRTPPTIHPPRNDPKSRRALLTLSGEPGCAR
jgi:hypothetical protein